MWLYTVNDLVVSLLINVPFVLDAPSLINAPPPPPDPMTISQEYWEKAEKSKIDHIFFSVS